MVRASGSGGVVVLASGAVSAVSSPSTGLVSLGVGLIGVWLARWVFVGRENRKLGVPQKWNDTLPLTLVAMLVAGVVIYDRQLGLSSSAFVGLGVGWAAVLLLDVMGERITNMLRAGFAVPLPKHVEEHLDNSGHGGRIIDETVIPPDMAETLVEIEETFAERERPDKDPKA